MVRIIINNGLMCRPAPRFSVRKLAVLFALVFSVPVVAQDEQSVMPSIDFLLRWGVARDQDPADLRDPAATFSAISSILSSAHRVPSRSILRQIGEQALLAVDSSTSAPIDPAAIIAFFERDPPLSSKGGVRYLQALQELDRSLDEVAAQLWRTLPLTAEAQDHILSLAPFLSPEDHRHRASLLINLNALREAERLLPLLAVEDQAFVRARLALIHQETSAWSLYQELTTAEQESLAVDALVWLVREDRSQEALAMVANASSQSPLLSSRLAWRYHRLALRALQRRGEDEAALASLYHHPYQQGIVYAEAEWLAGYTAFRLDRMAIAVTHFEAMLEKVTTPISRSRASYWLGRAHCAMGAMNDARAAFAVAASYPQAFYGLLANVELGQNPAFPERTLPPTSAQDPRTLLLHNLHDLHNPAWANSWLHRWILDADSVIELVTLAKAAQSLNDTPMIALAGGRIAAQSDWYPQLTHPRPQRFTAMTLTHPALALAITRRESGFDPLAISRSHAIGLMQIKPTTAAEVARNLNVSHSSEWLTERPAHNILLGHAYIAQQWQDFGNPVFAIAAYNAGPGRVGDWLSRLQAPERLNLDMITWIEAIPLEETRNYVMRVIEDWFVYRHLLGETITPQDDLLASFKRCSLN
ncbi:MAG: lytic transglycosylase domain-containing protein [Pseudomonadota bacterium]